MSEWEMEQNGASTFFHNNSGRVIAVTRLPDGMAFLTPDDGDIIVIPNEIWDEIKTYD